MKRKKWLIPVVAIGAMLVLVIAFVGVIAVNGLTVSQGRYLQAKNDTPMLIHGSSPTKLSYKTDRPLFDNLDTGDEILVIHGPVAESYPGQTRAWAVFKLRDGTIDDIPQGVIEQLIQLEWIDAE